MDRHRWIRAVLALAAAGLFVVAIGRADLGQVRALLTGTPLLWLAILPYVATQVCDAAASGRLLGAAGVPIRFGEAFRLRVVADAVALSLPGGQVFAEAVSVALLSGRGPLSGTLAGLASRRLAIGIGHGLVLLLAAAFGVTALRRASSSLLGVPGLEWLVAGAGIALVLGACGAGAALRRATVARAFAERLSDCLGGPSRRRWSVLALFAAGTLIESYETFFILTRLGSGLSFLDVLSFESFLSLSRSLLLVLPAGLGVQDVGYLAFLGALGVPNAATIGAAFVVVKRAKELVWIGVGWLWLWRMRTGPAGLSMARAAT